MNAEHRPEHHEHTAAPAARPQHIAPLRTLLRSRLVAAFASVMLLLAFGSIGYWVLGRLHYAGVLTPKLASDWRVLDCVYMTVITVSTIGYGEVLPGLDQLPWVRLYTIGLVLIAMILVAYSVSSATAFLVNGDLQRLLLRQRTMREIGRLRGHYIVCGCGVTGRVIIDELTQLKHPVVVVDTDTERLDAVRELPGVLALHGDATHDEILLEAGIEHAGGLAAVLRDDKDNLFVIISVRQLNPAVRIVSQASATDVQQKLLRAGANASVASSHIGGLRLVSQLIRPAVVTFLDEMLRHKEGAVRFAEVVVGGDWAGKPLGHLRATERTGLPVLALRRPGETFVFNPGSKEPLARGAVLVTMGRVEAVHELERLVGDDGGASFVTTDADLPDGDLSRELGGGGEPGASQPGASQPGASQPGGGQPGGADLGGGETA
ncbi:MAG: TrkA family potassium uptake protein [Planctomycetota bacterium]